MLCNTMLQRKMPGEGPRHKSNAAKFSESAMKSAICMVSIPSSPPPAPTSLLPAIMSKVQIRILYNFAHCKGWYAPFTIARTSSCEVSLSGLMLSYGSRVRKSLHELNMKAANTAANIFFIVVFILVWI